MSLFIQNWAVTSPPAVEPLSLSEAKLHCKVDITDDDDLITDLITAAREWVEKETRRAYINRSYQLRLNLFPDMFAATFYSFYSLERLPNQRAGIIELPRPPLISVDSIQYVDLTGTLQTLNPSQYIVDGGGACVGTISPAYGLVFPATRLTTNAVLINYTAGLGPDATTVPRRVKAAMKLMIGLWYRKREAAVEKPLTEMPMAVQALLSGEMWGSYG
jgi:uncharacterized phiE125 gp8 family phage protein